MSARLHPATLINAVQADALAKFEVTTNGMTTQEPVHDGEVVLSD